MQVHERGRELDFVVTRLGKYPEIATQAGHTLLRNFVAMS